mmetsp:Transcript_9528/g.15862  ORF Transcript_9528/g.15862 Transcript_9528/m.15862 type:complete len:97 (-) Transcript_9528:775-1065(-)
MEGIDIGRRAVFERKEIFGEEGKERTGDIKNGRTEEANERRTKGKKRTVLKTRIFVDMTFYYTSSHALTQRYLDRCAMDEAVMGEGPEWLPTWLER